MKYNILSLIKNRIDIDYRKFVNSIASKKRDLLFLRDYPFDIKILATAAPSCYANIIAKDAGFSVCLGTDFPNSAFNGDFENVKTRKKENVLNYLESKEISEIDTFVTDHIDDLPLINLAKNNFLIKPSESLLNHLKQNAISFEVIT